MDDTDFDVVKPVKEIDDLFDALHVEFVVEKAPEYSEVSMLEVWTKNQRLREKILLCQKEYMMEREQKIYYGRGYIKLLRSFKHMEEQYKRKIDLLYSEIKEAGIEISDLSGKLKSANEFIKQLIKEVNKKNDKQS